MKEIRKFTKSASKAELEKALEIINTALESRSQKEQEKQELLALLKEKGLTPADLLETAPDKRGKVAAKYRREYNGETVEWSGRGKRPKAFQGVDLDKYLI